MKIGNIDLGVRPVLLAPLEDITDQSFRMVCKLFGADVVYTEFISSEGLVRDARKSLDKLIFDESERPIGIQLFGHDAEAMRKAAHLACEAKPDLIDINFGCPVRKVVNKGGGSALMKDIPRMIEITKAVVKDTPFPVTVKTRLGWDENSKNIFEIAERLQDCGIAAITIHGRTRAQLYGGKADWTLIAEVKNNPRIQIPVIGNGDIDSAEKALEMFNNYGVDGIMVGRTAIGNPWIFRDIKGYLATGEKPFPVMLDERAQVCRQHLYNAVALKGEKKAIYEIRRHYTGYFRGIPDFKALRMSLLTAKTLQETEVLLNSIEHAGAKTVE